LRKFTRRKKKQLARRDSVTTAHGYVGVLDNQWKDHLLNMDHLKEGIGLRGYARMIHRRVQRDLLTC